MTAPTESVVRVTFADPAKETPVRTYPENSETPAVAGVPTLGGARRARTVDLLHAMQGPDEPGVPQSRWEGTTEDRQGPATTGSCGPDVRAAAALTAGPAVDAPARPADLDALESIPVDDGLDPWHLVDVTVDADGELLIPDGPHVALCGAVVTEPLGDPDAAGRDCPFCVLVARAQGFDL